MTKPSRIIASTTLMLLAACGGDSNTGTSSENVVNVYNWADYIAPDTIERFEAETGIKVNYDMYDANAVVDVKLLAGNSGYDVVFHSYSNSTRLVPIGVFQKLDNSRFSNYGNLDAELMERLDIYEFVTEYSLPYFWGTTGYAWNVEMVRERLPDHPMDSADILFEPELISRLADCGVSLLDDAGDMFSMTLSYLGLDPSAVDDVSLALAEEQIAKVRPYVRYFSNGLMLSDLPNEEVCVAMSWSGDYATAVARAKEAGLDTEFRYTTPKEGSRLWVTGIFIPTDAPHTDNAYLFMDFILRADITADITNTVHYANANWASTEFVDPDLLNDPAIYPDDDIWERVFAVRTPGLKEERARTRAFARVKSGL